MHPTIRKFPSKQFYQNSLIDHESINRRKSTGSLKSIEEVLFSRMIFFDIKDSQESLDDRSKCNGDEAELTKQLVEFLAFHGSKSGAFKNIAG
jgi:superfamily I DNA and/or RNA helicase